MKAFPRADGKHNSSIPDEKGMDLRDYFAAQVLGGYIAARAWHPDFIHAEDGLAAGQSAAEAATAAAYKFADAMMKAREKKDD
jgi:hypothetical protein